MFLDKLYSGFLLLETRQGLVRAELSIGRRIYLLWAFRNFRRLSVPLLNPRQRAVVDSVFRSHAGVVSRSQNPELVIGVIENFVPAAELTNTARSSVARVGASQAQKPVQKNERREKLAAEHAETALTSIPVSSSSPKVDCSKFVRSRFVTPGLGTAAGTLSLCIVSLAAWHHIQGVPASEAHNQPRLRQTNVVALPDSPDSAKPALVPHGRTAAPSTHRAGLVAPLEAIVKSPAIAAVAPASAPTSKQAIHVDAAATILHLPLSAQESGGIQASRPPSYFVYPDYPEIRARGVVALAAELDTDGAVRNVRIVSGNRALAAAAVRAVRQWRYRPYLKDGQSVATETCIVISFIADDAISLTFPPRIPATH